MSQYTVFIDKGSPAGSAPWSVNVFPSGHQGGVPVRNLHSDDEVRSVLTLLGVMDDRAKNAIFDELRKKGTYAFPNVSLSPEDAKSLGWVD
jgi:hypothetical protein